MPAKAGSDIKLTIDLKIQRACEEGLKLSMEVAEQTGYEHVWGVRVHGLHERRDLGARECPYLRSLGVRRWRVIRYME